MGKIVEKTVDLNANILYLKHEIVADTSKTQARIEFRNMAYGTITAVKFEARGYNAFGDEIQIDGESTFDIVAQDLIISPKKYAKLDIVLPNNNIRKLDLKLKQVCYANGKIVDEQLENKVTYKIENLDGTGNLEELEAKRLLKKKNDEAICFPKKIGQNWICICGYLNKNTDTICHQCGCRQIDIFEYCTEEKIQAQINEKKKKAAAEQAKQEEERIRLEEEEKRQREEWERQETEQRIKRTRRNKIITGIVVGIVICGVIGYFVNERVIIPKHKYNHAVSMMKNEKYQEAALEFSALGDYKDALKKTNEATYKNACQLLEAKLYDEAEKAFEGLGDYKDSADKIVEVENCKKQETYDDAMTLIDQRKYDEAIEILESLGDFGDAADQMKKIYYDQACKLLEKGQYTDAIEKFNKAGDYKDSKEKRTEAGYQMACGLWDDQEYDEAITIFKTLNGYKNSEEYVNSTEQDRKYYEAKKLLEKHKYATAAYSLEKLGDYKDAKDVLEKVPIQCKEYIDEKVNQQKITNAAANPMDVEKYAQAGVNDITTPFKIIENKVDYNDREIDANEFAYDLIDWIDWHCIRGYISFKSLGDLSQYHYDDAQKMQEGMELQKKIAQKFWNLAHKLDGKGKITASDLLVILSDDISDTLSEVNEWLSYFD